MKIKIQITSRITGSVLFEFEKENNTVKDTVAEALKQKADLSFADLSSADLSSADLSSADLSFADLSSADLSSADLSFADLSFARTDKRYIQIACIGSAKRMTTYCFDDDIVWCGCFKGSLDEFEAQVIKTHTGNEQYLKEYIGFIGYLRSLK